MEEHLQNSPQIGQTVDNVEAKYVSSLSTILVATIQEAKDRVSQIEYIFCSQLFPTFQSKSKTLQKIYSEAQKAAEDAWKETEKDLLCQIEELKLEKQRVLAENQALKLEKVNKLEEFRGNTTLLLKLRGQQEKIEELKIELKQKSKEVDDGMELHSKLVQLVQAKTLEVVSKDKQLKEHEEEINILLAEVKSLGKKVDLLQGELREKTEITTRKTEVTENLLKKIEFLSLEATNTEQRLNDMEKDKKRLMTRLEIFEEKVGRLEEILGQKTDELDERRKMLEQLHQKLDVSETEMMKSKQQLVDHEKEKKMLLDKVKSLEEEIGNLHSEFREGSCKAGEGSDVYKDLHQQIELKSSELATERKKKRDAIDAFKRVKSQYNFLCKRFGLTTESIHYQNKLKDECDPLRKHESPTTSPDLENKISDKPEATSGENRVKSDSNFSDSGENEKIIKMVQTSASSSTTTNFPIAQKCPSGIKSAPVAGTKRPASIWRDTRARQSPGGPDPHDDFLDTPLENVRKELNKVIREGDQDLADANKDDSDDETQDMNPDPSPRKQRIQVMGTSNRSFKYVEPVRKKAEREKLKGIECRQCKKFYDAVLPENGGKDGEGNKKSLRCEHHEGVSRHRYKYAPPMTPEGFWNIGFESEM